MFNITVIMEMKINTTLRYQYTPKWLKLKKKKVTPPSAGKRVEKNRTLYTAVGKVKW